MNWRNILVMSHWNATDSFQKRRRMPRSELIKSGPVRSELLREVPLNCAEQSNTTRIFFLTRWNTPWCGIYQEGLESSLSGTVSQNLLSIISFIKFVYSCLYPLSRSIFLFKYCSRCSAIEMLHSNFSRDSLKGSGIS